MFLCYVHLHWDSIDQSYFGTKSRQEQVRSSVEGKSEAGWLGLERIPPCCPIMGSLEWQNAA